MSFFLKFASFLLLLDIEIVKLSRSCTIVIKNQGDPVSGNSTVMPVNAPKSMFK